MYWSPNFLAVVFKKQEISQQVVTRMQEHLFSQIFPGWYPQFSQREGATFSRTQHPARERGANVSVLGPIPCPPLKLFSRGCTPGSPPGKKIDILALKWSVWGFDVLSRILILKPRSGLNRLPLVRKYRRKGTTNVAGGHPLLPPRQRAPWVST